MGSRFPTLMGVWSACQCSEALCSASHKSPGILTPGHSLVDPWRRGFFMRSNNSRIGSRQRNEHSVLFSFDFVFLFGSLPRFKSFDWSSLDPAVFAVPFAVHPKSKVTGMILARTLHHEKHGATDSAVGTVLPSNHHPTVLRFMQ